MNARIITKITAGALILMLAVVGCQNVTDVTPPHTELEGQYIVVMKDSPDGKFKLGNNLEIEPIRDEILRDIGIEESNVLNKYNHAIAGFTAKLSTEQAEQLAKDERVKFVEKDQIIVLAPPCGTPAGGPCDDDGGGGDSGQTTPWGIDRVGGAVNYSGSNVAWIIDTGVDLDHPDLNVDTQRSTVFVTRGPGSGDPDDGNGHGTHVAGTIAAINNDIDVVGVAAGATVVGVKVLDNRGSGQYSWVINGIDYVAANGAPGDVANMSLGGGTSDALDDAVRNAADQGILFSIAAGNDGADANNYSPARVEYNNVWTVSATDDTDTFASFSNWSGPTNPPIEYAAPGVSILSLWMDGGTRTISGTSMSAPHVGGVLLATGGSPSSNGTANSDPDGDPDPIVSQ